MNNNKQTDNCTARIPDSSIVGDCLEFCELLDSVKGQAMQTAMPACLVDMRKCTTAGATNPLISNPLAFETCDDANHLAHRPFSSESKTKSNA